MDKVSERERVYAALKTMTEGKYAPALLNSLDLNGPAMHEEKSEYKIDKEGIDNARRHLLGLYNSIKQLSKSQLERLNNYSYKTVLGFKDISVLKIAGIQGVIESLNDVLLLFYDSVSAETETLKREFEQFWSGKGRSPNWRARFLAKRVADIFVRSMLKKPTYGTDNNYPSTPYARALQEIFEICEIKMDIRKPAEWAISQISDEYVELVKNPLLTPFALGLIKTSPK